MLEKKGLEATQSQLKLGKFWRMNKTVVLLLTFMVFSLKPTEIKAGKCEPLKIPMCENVPYGQTEFPNWSGDENQEGHILKCPHTPTLTHTLPTHHPHMPTHHPHIPTHYPNIPTHFIDQIIGNLIRSMTTRGWICSPKIDCCRADSSYSKEDVWYVGHQKASMIKVTTFFSLKWEITIWKCQQKMFAIMTTKGLLNYNFLYPHTFVLR